MLPVAALLALLPVVLATDNTGTVVPTVPVNGKNWCAKGCFDELKGGLQALNHDISSTLSSITVENCVNGCAAAGYTIAGMMNGDRCLCDNAMSAQAPALPAESCNRPCTGNPLQVCGGTQNYEIYYDCNGTVPNPQAPPTVGSGCATYTSIGCYVDVVSSRTLADKFFRDDNMTPELCAAACYAEGYQLAGVEFGKECYCADEFTEPVLADLGLCNQACGGNSALICGGPALLNVYSLDDSACNPTTPTTTTTTTTSSTPVNTPPPNTTSGTKTTTSCTTSATTPSNPNPPHPKPTCGNYGDNGGSIHWGCFNDNPSRRTLNQYKFSSNRMTPDLCSDTCLNKGYQYSGIENGKDCYCGSSAPRNKADKSKCNVPCSGDKKHSGGGKNNSGCLTIYQAFTNFPQSRWPRKVKNSYRGGNRGWH
ncbi:WSC-domain-containing protein [Serendipita vermifera]|nr:WSC-domain-containing protein [Serendipita vermifera]